MGLRPNRGTRASRGARGDGRVDIGLLGFALLIAIVARALPQTRADNISGALRHTALAPLSGLQSRAERARRAIVVHDSVTLHDDSVAIRAFEATRLVSENETLRRLLGLGARLGTGFIAADAMHGPELGEAHTLVLNAGRDAGVEPFSPVISADGIVGYVRSADATSSIAIVWPHPDFRVSATAVTGSAAGIVSPHLGDGTSRYLLELHGVPQRAPLDSGTLIVSSGVGGTFPRGIPIGTVMHQLPSVEGWERTYLIMPLVRPADVGAVLILIRDKTKPDLHGVWTSVDSAAAATKRIAAAADSLARLNAARDSAKREADKRDSVKRDSVKRDTVKRGGP